MQSQIKVMQSLPKYQRKYRNPEHRWNLRQAPYQIQPCLIAPVLPGETLKNVMFQARVVTDPIKNPLIGWWNEYYFFYVKLRDLKTASADTMVNLMITPGSNTSSMNTAPKIPTYHNRNNTNPDFAQECLEVVVDRFFRDEDETWNTATLANNMPLAKAEHPGWMDSLIDTTQLPDGGILPGGASNPNAEEVNVALNNYEYLRGMKFIDMTFEDYCRSYGVNIPTAEEINKPELIRYVREWSYPVNHVEPTTGVPSSAVSWAHRERIDKDRFFREPGFIFGVTVCRPKLYFSRQVESMSNYMNTAFSWLPAIMSEQPETSLREFAASGGPLTTTTNGYWVDMRDLLMYGDQFLNFDLSATDAGLVALPTAGLNKRYVDQTMIDALFSNAAGGFNLVRQDGVAKLSILGKQVDMT